MKPGQPVPVLLAVPGPAESALVGGWEPLRREVVVVRRCADLQEVLAAAVAGLGRAVVLGADLPGADAETVERVVAAGAGLVVVLPDGADGESAERRWRSCGARWFARAGEAPDAVARTVVEAAEAVSRPAEVEPVPGAAAVPPGPVPPPALVAVGRTLAVWGPAGSHGRTTLAVEVAAELAASGADVLLVDLDTRGAAAGQVLGVLDEAPGVLAAVRAAVDGRLDVASLRSAAPECLPGVALLTGSPDPARWSELRPVGVRRLLEVAAAGWDWVVVDLPGGLEEEGSRDAAALTALESADAVVVLGRGDPVGLQRWVRGWQRCAELLPGVPAVGVLNRVRAGAAGPAPQRRVREVARRFAGAEDVHVLPEDPAVDQAQLAGRAVQEVAPRSPLRTAVATLVRHLEAVVDAPRPPWEDVDGAGFDRLLARR